MLIMHYTVLAFFASCSFIASFFSTLERSTDSAGCAISLFSDFLGDTRFGFCYGIFLADRNRCCGGSENVDFLLETCLRAERIKDGCQSKISNFQSGYFSHADGRGKTSETNLYILQMATESQVGARWSRLLAHYQFASSL